MLRRPIRIGFAIAALTLASCSSAPAPGAAAVAGNPAPFTAAGSPAEAPSGQFAAMSAPSADCDAPSAAAQPVKIDDLLRSLPALTADQARKAVDDYMTAVAADSAAYRKAAEAAETTLFDTASPAADETLYRLFVDRLLADTVLTPTEKIRYEYHRNILAANPVGSKAPDFTMLTRSGNEFSLGQILGAPRTLLVFYDSDCNECMSTLEKMMMSRRVESLIDEGALYVAVIDIAGNRAAWQSKMSVFPTSWLVGYDDGLIESDELYSLRNTPSLYLLDSAGLILAKDTTWPRLSPLL